MFTKHLHKYGGHFAAANKTQMAFCHSKSITVSNGQLPMTSAFNKGYL